MVLIGDLVLIGDRSYGRPQPVPIPGFVYLATWKWQFSEPSETVFEVAGEVGFGAGKVGLILSGIPSFSLSLSFSPVLRYGRLSDVCRSFDQFRGWTRSGARQPEGDLGDE